MFGSGTHRTSAFTKWNSSQPGQADVEGYPLANERGVARGNEDNSEADVAGLGGQLLAADAKGDWSSHVDATLARYEGHVPATVDWSGSGASRTRHNPHKELPRGRYPDAGLFRN
jgi:hypothetical protein